MDGRSALGPADVSDDQLVAMVADLLGADPRDTAVQGSTVEEFPYDLPAITTAGRYWVSGTAIVADEERPWRMFVKHIQSWSRSPFFGEVPPEYREMAEASVPWRTEALTYHAPWLHTRPEDYSPQVRNRLETGLAYSGLQYLEALRWRAHALEAHLAATAKCDAVLAPVSRAVAPTIVASSLPRQLP